MAEKELKEAILERIRREKEEILNQAKKERDTIFKQAHEEAEVFKKEYLSELNKICSRERFSQLSRIKYGMESRLWEEKERVISQVLLQVKDELKAILKDKSRYKVIFRELLEESLGTLEKKANLKVKVNPADEKLAQEVLKEIEISCQLETESAIDAGCQVSDLEESVIITNTFKSRLERLTSQLRSEISQKLFMD